MTPRIIVANLVARLTALRRERSAMFFTIAFPVILVLVFGEIFTRAEHRNFDLPVQDLDQTALSQELLDTLAVGGVFRPTPVPVDADPARYAQDHKLTLVLVIPRGFQEMHARRTRGGDADASVVLTCLNDHSSTSVPTKLHLLTSIIAAANQRMSGTVTFMRLEERSILEAEYRFIDFFVPGIIAMAVMTSCLSGALLLNAELLQKGILRKLATTPITAPDWLLSNILYQLVLAAVSTTAILAVSYTVFDVRLHLNGWLPVYIVLEVFAFVGIGMMLTSVAREAESATAAANAFLFPMMFLSGTFFPVEMMPGFLQQFAKVLPLYYVNEGLRAAMILNDDTEALRCAVITAGVAVVVFVAGAVVTRWEKG